MTQIIAALCENRNKIVMVADRMVSDADDTLHFEHEPKGQMLSYNAMILTSGTLHEPEIVNISREEIAGRMKLPQMIDILTNNYRITRKKRIEIEILSKHGFMSFNEYHEKQQLLADSIVECIEAELFAAIDSNSGQIYVVEDPGTAHSHTEVGFCCLGSGDRHADPIFAFYDFKPTMSELETLYISYVAKRRGEMAGGVGKDTDAWILDAKGCFKVKDETLNKLGGCLQTADLSDLLGNIVIERNDDPELPNENG
jgi:hypothetical protein